MSKEQTAMKLNEINQLLTRSIADMTERELENMNAEGLEEGDVIRFPKIPKAELDELEGLLKRKARAREEPERAVPSSKELEYHREIERYQDAIRLYLKNKGKNLTKTNLLALKKYASTAKEDLGIKHWGAFQSAIQRTIDEVIREREYQKKLSKSEKARAETTQPSKREKTAPKGPSPKQATSEKPQTVTTAQAPIRPTFINKGQAVMIHKDTPRKAWYLERTTAGTYVAVGGGKMHRAKTMDGAVRWLWDRATPAMQKKIQSALYVGNIKAGNAPPEEKVSKPAPKRQTTSKVRITSPKQTVKYGIIGDKKFLTPTARLIIGDHGFTLEEMPQKGMRRVRELYVQDMSRGGPHSRAMDQFWPVGLIQDARLKKTDSYDQIKTKLSKAHDVAYRRAKKMDPEHIRDWMSSMKKISQESTKPSTQVEPENTPPIQARTATYYLNATWKNFTIGHKSGGTIFTTEASSPTAARKLYKILASNPNAIYELLKNPDKWLAAKKIRTKSHTRLVWG
jgi:hypothetical protein